MNDDSILVNFQKMAVLSIVFSLSFLVFIPLCLFFVLAIEGAAATELPVVWTTVLTWYLFSALFIFERIRISKKKKGIFAISVEFSSEFVISAWMAFAALVPTVMAILSAVSGPILASDDISVLMSPVVWMVLLSLLFLLTTMLIRKVTSPQIIQES